MEEKASNFLISYCLKQFIAAVTEPMSESMITRGLRYLVPAAKADTVNLMSPYTPSFNIILANIMEQEPDASPCTSGSQV